MKDGKIMTFNIKLGQKVRDKVTGFEGTAVARTEWLYGCVRFGVQSDKLKEGAPIELQTFDEGGLEVIKEEKEPSRKKTGGDHPTLPRSKEPGR
jgi:hypothetical protein